MTATPIQPSSVRESSTVEMKGIAMNTNRNPFAVVCLALLSLTLTASANWIGSVNGVQDYLLSTNWDGGVINDVVLPGLITSSFTMQLGADHSTLGNGTDWAGNGKDGDLVIWGQDGGGGAQWSLTASGNRTLYLAGDFYFDRAGHGSPSLGSTLTLDLLGGNRLFSGGSGDVLMINGPVTNGGITYAGPGTVRFTSTSNPAYGGPTSVTGGAIQFDVSPASSYLESRGGTLTLNNVAPAAAATLSPVSGTIILQGANGVVGSGNTVAMAGGTLQLGNGTGNNNDRLPDSLTIDLSRNDRLRLRGVDSGDTTETVSAQFGGLGRLNGIAGTSGTSVLTVDAQRVQNGLLILEGANLGSADNQIKFTTAPTLLGAGGAAGTTTISIVPWVSAGANATQTFATYDAATGFRLLDTSTEFRNYTIGSNTSISEATADDNVWVRSTAGDGVGIALGATSKTINSLVYLAQGSGHISGSGGTLTLNSGVMALRNGGNPLGISVSTLNFGGNEGIIRVEAAGGAAAVNERVTISSSMTNTGGNGLTLRALSNTADNGRIILSGANTYTGPTTIAFGRVEVSNVNAIPDSSQVRIGPEGTFRLAAAQTIGGLEGTGLVTTDGNSRNLTLATTTDYGFGGAIASTVNLIKTGAATQTLTGTNTYTGTTTISQGTMLVNGTHIGGGDYIVEDGGTLGGSGMIGAPVTVNVGGRLTGTATVTGATTIHGTHAPGASPGIDTYTDGLEYIAGSTLEWELFGQTSSPADRGVLYDGVNVTGGNLVIDGGATLALVFNATDSTVDWNDPFWDERHTWTIIDFSGGGSSLDLFANLNPSLDSNGLDLADLRIYHSFWVTNSGGSIILNYKPIPEPGTALVFALGGLALLKRRARRA